MTGTGLAYRSVFCGSDDYNLNSQGEI